MYNKLSRFATLLGWTGLLILGWGIFLKINDPKDAERQAQYLAERQRFCKDIGRSSIVEKMMQTGAIHKMDTQSGRVTVHVTDVWMALPFEQKEKLDKMLQCYGEMRSDGSAFSTYLDYRTGKVVAKYGAFGFRME